MIIRGNILNVFTDEIYPGEIKIEQGIIESIKESRSILLRHNCSRIY